MSACLDHTSIQRDYIGERNACQSEAENNISHYIDPNKPGDPREQNAKLVTLFSDCMFERGWTVATPEREEAKGVGIGHAGGPDSSGVSAAARKVPTSAPSEEKRMLRNAPTSAPSPDKRSSPTQNPRAGQASSVGAGINQGGPDVSTSAKKNPAVTSAPSPEKAAIRNAPASAPAYKKPAPQNSAPMPRPVPAAQPAPAPRPAPQPQPAAVPRSVPAPQAVPAPQPAPATSVGAGINQGGPDVSTSARQNPSAPVLRARPLQQPMGPAAVPQVVRPPAAPIAPVPVIPFGEPLPQSVPPVQMIGQDPYAQPQAGQNDSSRAVPVTPVTASPQPAATAPVPGYSQPRRVLPNNSSSGVAPAPAEPQAPLPAGCAAKRRPDAQPGMGNLPQVQPECRPKQDFVNPDKKSDNPLE